MADTQDLSLTPSQANALFDILVHRNVYAEIEAFKQPTAIDNYGPPFQDKSNSDTPILQSLLSKFALTLPGLSQVKPNFWRTYVKDLVQELGEAELSESYDKGSLGIRKTIATALSALLEYPARGILGGFDHNTKLDPNKAYDTSSADDILAAWRDGLQDMVYGDLVERMFDKARQTPDLKEHESKVQAMHEYIIVNIASLIHYTLVLSPEGASLVRMIDMVHKLLPYAIMRQTLRVGNAATMISGMMRVMLAKVSVASVTNWIGLSAGADEGMNLMQQIISQVLSWDKRDLKKRADKIERDPNLVPKEVTAEIKDYITRTRAEHEECRRQSREQGISIVQVILSLSSLSIDLTEEQHARALEYLSLNLAIRDRTEIVKVLCQRNPDHLTAAVREGVEAYTPMIRNVHQAVDLSAAIWDFECFVTDMLKISKPNPNNKNARPPIVEDYVDLLHNHQASSHKFIHQIAKNGPEVVEWWRKYLHDAAAHFRTDSSSSSPTSISPSSSSATPAASSSAVPATKATIPPPSTTTSKLRTTLQQTFTNLSTDDKRRVLHELDSYDAYMRNLETETTSRIDAVVKRTGEARHGPGAYLARWQDLLDRTRITPASLQKEAEGAKSRKGDQSEGRSEGEGRSESGHVRRGDDDSVQRESQRTVDGQIPVDGSDDHDPITSAERDKGLKPPRVDRTWDLFAPAFQAALRG